MKTLRALIVLTTAAVATLATTFGGLAQEGERPELRRTQEGERPQFRAEVAAVLVDVLVLDEEGRPVSGLTREDFEIYEDGVKQEIQNFDVIDWTSYVAQKAPTDLEPIPAEPSGSVNTFPRRFVFVINRQGAEFGYMIRARKAMETFVVESMADGDEAMVIDMGMSTRITQQFTPFKEEVLSSIRKLRPMPADQFHGLLIGTRNIYETLQSLGDGLAALPGRKVVLFMSPELARTNELLPDLQKTVDALNQSNTTVYSIDIEGSVAGITAENSGIEEQFLAAFDIAGDPNSIQPGTSSPNSFDVGGLFPLAYETGGRYFYNLNNFEPAVRRIGRENQRYYLLTYYPVKTEIDDKYRRIDVGVSRPDVTVNARKGYFPRKADDPVVADEDQEKPPSSRKAPPTPEAPSEKPAAPANLAPSPPKQVEISNYLFPAADGKVDVPIVVALPLELLTTNGGSSTLGLTLTDGSGKSAGQFSTDVTPEKFFAVSSILLDPGAYLLQITLTQAGKEIYRASTQVDVPSSFGERFGISTVAPIFEPSESAGIEGPPIRPTPSLRVGEDVFLHFRVFPGRRGEPSKSIEIVYSIYHEDMEVTSLKQPEPVDISKAGDKGFPVVAKLPTRKLTAGTYRIVVRISDPNLGRRASGEIELVFSP